MNKKEIVWKDKVIFTLDHSNSCQGKWKSVEKQTGLTICYEKTKKKVVQLTLKIFEEKGLNEILGCIAKSLKIQADKKELSAETTITKFKEFFGRSLMQFVDPVFNSFDIIAFDKWLMTPDGISTKDFLTQKYGEDASKFIEHINQL
jgi:hypothetical protein